MYVCVAPRRGVLFDANPPAGAPAAWLPARFSKAVSGTFRLFVLCIVNPFRGKVDCELKKQRYEAVVLTQKGKCQLNVFFIQEKRIGDNLSIAFWATKKRS